MIGRCIETSLFEYIGNAEEGGEAEDPGNMKVVWSRDIKRKRRRKNKKKKHKSWTKVADDEDALEGGT